MILNCQPSIHILRSRFIRSRRPTHPTSFVCVGSLPRFQLKRCHCACFFLLTPSDALLWVPFFSVSKIGNSMADRHWTASSVPSWTLALWDRSTHAILKHWNRGAHGRNVPLLSFFRPSSFSRKHPMKWRAQWIGSSSRETFLRFAKQSRWGRIPFKRNELVKRFYKRGIVKGWPALEIIQSVQSSTRTLLISTFDTLFQCMFATEKK